MCALKNDFYLENKKSIAYVLKENILQININFIIQILGYIYIYFKLLTYLQQFIKRGLLFFPPQLAVSPVAVFCIFLKIIIKKKKRHAYCK